MKYRNWITKYRNWKEKYANWKAKYANWKTKYTNWKAHGLIGLTIMIYPIWFWLLPDIWEYWQGMCACEAACQEECPMESTYDILPLLAPPLPIILLMAWWASILLSREIHTPHEYFGRPIKPSNSKDPGKAPRSGKMLRVIGVRRRRRESLEVEVIVAELSRDEDQPHVMLEQNSADRKTPATTNLTNGNKPEDK